MHADIVTKLVRIRAEIAYLNVDRILVFLISGFIRSAYLQLLCSMGKLGSQQSAFKSLHSVPVGQLFKALPSDKFFFLTLASYSIKLDSMNFHFSLRLCCHYFCLGVTLCYPQVWHKCPSLATFSCLVLTFFICKNDDTCPFTFFSPLIESSSRFLPSTSFIFSILSYDTKLFIYKRRVATQLCTLVALRQMYH